MLKNFKIVLTLNFEFFYSLQGFEAQVTKRHWAITNVFEYNGLFEYFEQNPDRSVLCCSDIVYRFHFLCTNVCTVSMYYEQLRRHFGVLPKSKERFASLLTG